MINFLLFAVKCFLKCIFRIQINGADNIPAEGGCMVCANHISNWDPVVLICCLPRRISFVAKEEIKSVPFVGWLLEKVDVIFIKRGSGDLGAIRTCIKGIDEGKAIGIFPTGTREKICADAKPKSGATLIAAKAGTKVVPVGVEATYKLFSKITINIGELMDFAEYKGTKLSQDMLESKTNEIYDKIIENRYC